MNLIEQHLCYGGTLSVYEHQSTALNCAMKFSIFLPKEAKTDHVPFITFLSGLTCTHDNFTTKAGAYGVAAELGMAIVAPDTSPRGDDIPDDDNYDFGKGAGFYLDATEAPWSKNYRMETYITEELNTLVCNEFPLDSQRQGITGHSMGGHGALTLHLKHPELYKSASAFAPIVAPSQVPWGEKAFTGYLGNNKDDWKRHDACALMTAAGNREDYPMIHIDQGTADNFLTEQLRPELFEDACKQAGQSLKLRFQDGYDHSYYFIQSFIGDHIRHHHGILNR